VRNFLTTSDIARLSGYTRAQVWNWAKAGLIPARRVNRHGKHHRYIDSPEIRGWCEAKLSRGGGIYELVGVIAGIALEILCRDCPTDLADKLILAEIDRQLCEAKDPDQLLKKWAQALADGCRDDLPRINLASACSDISAELWRLLLESKDPGQLLKKWGQAIVDHRPDDLPRVP
jgi:hypothetical protein